MNIFLSIIYAHRAGAKFWANLLYLGGVLMGEFFFNDLLQSRIIIAFRWAFALRKSRAYYFAQ